MSLFDEHDLHKKSVKTLPTLEQFKYVPENKPRKPIDYFTQDQLMREFKDKSVLAWDIEVYKNYFLIAFKSVKTGKSITFEMSPNKTINFSLLEWVIHNFCVVGFNSLRFDEILLWMVIRVRNVRTEQLKQASDMIIMGDARAKDICEAFGFKMGKIKNHIDIMEVAPVKGSLKTYGGRLHTRKMQDLPIEPHAILTEEEAEETKYYCINDLDQTLELFLDLEKQIKLREDMGRDYKLDLRSKSDAQVAEAVIRTELFRLDNRRVQRPTIPIGTEFFYKVPDYLNFQTKQMQDLLQTIRTTPLVVSPKGSIINPFGLDKSGNLVNISIYNAITGAAKDNPLCVGPLTVSMGSSKYTVGIGGLHSNEKASSHIIGNSAMLMDIDVASFYPFIILNQGLFPQHMGASFLEVYRYIVETRLKAKRAGNKIIADSLKITINGSFGKFGSKYSILYAPDLLVQVTISGQLSLLLLIERYELAGYSVVSANTDGIVLKFHSSDYEAVQAIYRQWEYDTMFEMEETHYSGIYSRDVNNYIAVKTDGEYKAKGSYSEPGLSKNPTSTILINAVSEFIIHNTPIEKTVTECTDVSKFVVVRNVKGGAQKDGHYLGKVIRWYYKKGEYGTINYKLSGNKVPQSDGAYPLMELDGLPTDINYDWYINEAHLMLDHLGFHKKHEGLKIA